MDSSKPLRFVFWIHLKSKFIKGLIFKKIKHHFEVYPQFWIPLFFCIKFWSYCDILTHVLQRSNMSNQFRGVNMRDIKKHMILYLSFCIRVPLTENSPSMRHHRSGSKKTKALFLSRDRLEKYQPYHWSFYRNIKKHATFGIRQKNQPLNNLPYANVRFWNL